MTLFQEKRSASIQAGLNKVATDWVEIPKLHRFGRAKLRLL